MKRKITILTIAFLLSGLMCANAFAAATGRCGDSITWTLDDSGNLTLSGSGEMWNYNDSPFKYYGIKTVTIGDGITSIGKYAFGWCSELTELTLPNSVTSIGYAAFEVCTGLTELTLSNSVTSIGAWAFYGCSSMAELTLPNSLESIGNNAFSWCSELTELTLPNSVTSIGNSAFQGCSGLEKIMVESGNSRYDSRDNCNSIIDTETNTLIVGCNNSVIPNGVTSIGYAAFGWCSELTELTLPNSVTSIGNSAFEGCSGLEKITVESGNSRYDSRDNCNSIIETATNTLIAGCKNSIIPNSVTSIGDYAFSGCSGMTELTLPNSVTSIEESAFKNCSGLAKITSSAGIPPVCGSGVFYGVNKTNCELIIPKESVAAYKQAEGWKEFSNIRLLAAISGRCGDSITWTIDDSGNLTLSGSGEMWDYNKNDLLFKYSGIKTVTIGDGITSIGNSAFEGCSGLTKLTLPNSVTSIGDYAFEGCSGMTELTLPSSVTRIGNSAFSGCSGLAKIASLAVFPPVCASDAFSCVTITCRLIVPGKSVVAYKQARGWNYFKIITAATGHCGDSIAWTLDDSGNLTLSGSGEMWDYNKNDLLFKDSGIKTVTIGDGITSIGKYAFCGCRGLTKLTLPNSVTSIGDSAFEGCSGLTKLTLPNSVTSIGDYAFYGCSGMTELILPSSVTRIGNSAFYGCSGLTELTLPNSVTSIGYYAFYGCIGLTELTLPNSITSIWEGAFFGCSGLTKLTLPNSVTRIGNSAFYGCSGLTELTLPNSVTSIGNSAFEGCSGLTELTLPSSVTGIGESAFQGCSGLTKLTLPSSVTSIGNSAFRGCRGLTELTLPNSITSIGDYAFYSCRGLTELVLPNSVTSIGKYAFKGCIGLEKITSLAEIPPMCGRKVFDGVNKTNGELIVPEGSVAAYKQAEVWNEFSNISGFSGVEDTVADGNTIRVIGNQIEISGYFTSVEVYGVNGTLIYKGKDNVVTVPSVGIYLVHVAGKTRKIVVE